MDRGNRQVASFGCQTEKCSECQAVSFTLKRCWRNHVNMLKVFFMCGSQEKENFFSLPSNIPFNLRHIRPYAQLKSDLFQSKLYFQNSEMFWCKLGCELITS